MGVLTAIGIGAGIGYLASKARKKKKPEVTPAQQGQPASTVADSVPAPPPTANEATSEAVAQARQVATRRRRKAIGGGFAGPRRAVGSVVGRAANSGSVRSIIGSVSGG